MPKVLVMSALLTLLLGAVAPAGATAEPTQVLAHGPGSHGESGGVTIVGGPANDEVVIGNPDPSTILVLGLAGATVVQECQLLNDFLRGGERPDRLSAGAGKDLFTEPRTRTLSTGEAGMTSSGPSTATEIVSSTAAEVTTAHCRSQARSGPAPL
jgi:hypothetical protein